MSEAEKWRPLSNGASLRLRAAMLSSTRNFFAARDVLEVETPVLGSTSVTDPHIDSIRVGNQDNDCWLRTSPEYHMKRLLAAGSGDIYQIAKVFRAAESGTRHQPEFTMLEWYRTGFNLQQMISETCELITALGAAGNLQLNGYDTTDYRDAFRNSCNIDPLHAPLDEIRAAAEAQLADNIDGTLRSSLANQRAAWLDLLATHIVHPSLPKGRLQVISAYPADQAMLARRNPHDVTTAERFEVFLDGVELANGYRELTDAGELAMRFERDNEARAAANKPQMEPDAMLLDAMRAGLPECSGVSVGLDRLMMLAGGYTTLAETLSFRPGD